MSIKKFITDVLNVDPDLIDSIDSVKSSDGSVTLYLKLVEEHDPKCKFCKHPLIKNGFYNKKLVHSTLVNRPCTIIYARRRYICSSCGVTFSERNPFAREGDNITYETIHNVLEDLRSPSATYTMVAKRYNISVTKVLQIFDKYVDIPRKPLPEVLSIDEHYFPASDYDSLYICLLMDFKTGELLDVLPDRKKNYLIHYFGNIRNETLDEKTGRSELSNVKYVSIDLNDVYRQIAESYFPRALICGDSFHVTENLTKAFSSVRLKCLHTSQNEDYQYLLSKFKYIFDHGKKLDNPAKYNKRFRRYMNYQDMMDLLFKQFPNLKKAYELKESYLDFNSTATISNAADQLADQIHAFADSKIPEYVSFYNLLINWNREIINSFSTVDGRRINNSYIESRNSIIELLFINGNGYKNFRRARNRILYCVNKNEKYKF